MKRAYFLGSKLSVAIYKANTLYRVPTFAMKQQDKNQSRTCERRFTDLLSAFVVSNGATEGRKRAEQIGSAISKNPVCYIPRGCSNEQRTPNT